MASMTPEQAALRAAAAGDYQEIAIFRDGDREREVLCVFERTVMTQRWIREGTHRLIGVYGGSDTYHEILKEIRKCMRQS